MKDMTIAAALSKYVDPRFFSIGVILHAFEQDQPTHVQKLQFVHCLNVIRKNHVRMEQATDADQANRIFSDTFEHAQELDTLIERLSSDVSQEL